MTRASEALELVSSFASPASLLSLFRRAKGSKLGQDAAKLLFLQFASRLVAFFASAHAIRSLGPDQLGIGAFALAVATQCAVLGDLGLNIAGVRSLGDQPERQTETVSTVFGIRLRASLLLAVLLLAWALLFHPAGSSVVWILAAPLVVILVLNPQWIYQGIERVPLFNALQFVQTLTAAALYVALFQPGAVAQLYVAVALGSQALSWALAYLFLRKHVRIDPSLFRWRLAWEMLRKSGYAFAIVLTIFVYTGLDIPLVTLLLSTHDAGVYRAAQSVVGAMTPLLIILPLLVYPRLLAWKNESLQTFVRNAWYLVVALSALALLIAASSLIWVPIAVDKLFGPEYLDGIVPCIVLVAAKCIVLVGAIPAWGLHSLNLDRRYFVVTLAAAVTSVTSNLLLIGRFGIIAAAGTSLLSEVIITAGAGIAIVTYVRSVRAAEGGPRSIA